MANAIVLTKDGVTVQKELVTEGLPMPAVRFALRSDRSVPMAVRMSETLPEGVSVSDIGFHKEYDRDCWRTDGGQRLAYERVVEPGERVITVYFVRDETMDSSAFENPPSIDMVRAMDGDEEATAAAPLFRGAGARTETPIEDAVIVNADVNDVEAARNRTAVDPEPIDLDPPSNSAERENGAGVDSPSDSFTEASPDEPLRLNESDVWDAEEGSDDFDEDGFREARPDVPLELNDPTESMDAESSSESADGEPPDPESSGVRGTDDERSEGDAEAAGSGSTSLEDVSSIDTTPRVSDDVTVTAASTLDEAQIEALVDERIEDRLGRDLEEQLEERTVRIVEREVDQAIRERADSIESLVTDALERKLDEAIESRIGTLVDESVEAGAIESTDRPSEPVTDRFVAELRDGVDDATVDSLRALLPVGTPNHLEARIKRVEGEVNELAAYTDALREFLDENGPARALLEDIDDRMATLESHSETLTSRYESVDDRLETIEADVERVSTLRDDVDAIADRIDRHETGFESGMADVDSLVDNVGTIAGRIDDLADRVDTLSSRNDRIVDVFETLARELSDPDDGDRNRTEASDEADDR